MKPEEADIITRALQQAGTEMGQLGADLKAGALQSLSGLDHDTSNLFLVLDRASHYLSKATGLPQVSAFGKVAEYYKQEAQTFADKAAEQGPAPNIGSKISRIIGGLPAGLATAGAAAMVGGPIGGFAALGALEAADQGPGAAAIGAAKGAGIGKLFGATHGASRLARAGTIGPVAAAMDAATGAPPEDAALSGATMGVLGALAKPAPGALRIRDLASEHARQVLRKTANLRARSGQKVEARGQAAVEQVEAERPGPAVSTSRLPNEILVERGISPNPNLPAAPNSGRVLNLNLDRIQGPADFKQAQARVLEFMREDVQLARRGKITLLEIERMAHEMGYTPAQLMARQKGEAFNAETITAARFLTQSTFKELRDTARLAIDPKTSTPKIQAKLYKNMALFEASASSMLGATAEAGRALSAMRIIAGPTPKSIGEVRRALSQLQTETKVPPDKLAEMILRLERPGEASRVLAEMRKATTGEKAIEAWINWGLLSGPQTHAVNILSNTATALWAVPETYVAGGFSAARSRLARMRNIESSDRVFLREGTARLFGLLEGSRDGIVLAAKALKTGEPSDLFGTTKFDIPRQSIKGRLGKVARLPGRLLIAEDEFFKTLGFRQELWAQAVRKSSLEGKRGGEVWKRASELVREPTEAMRQAASDNAHYQTFTTEMGKTAQSISDFANSHPVARVLLPFVRTPTNIFKYATARTPAALLMKETVMEPLRRGGAEADQILGRIAFASGLAMLTTVEALKGNITGSGPSNPDLRNEWLLNHQPYSFRIPGTDQFIAYGRIDPLASIIGISADYAEVVANIDDPEVRDKAAWLLIMSVMNNFTNKTFMTGMSDFFEVLQDPERHGPEWVQRLVGTVVPNAINQYNRTQDPYLREADGIIEQIKSRLPEYSTTLLPRLNVWGEPIMLNHGIGPDLISPLYHHNRPPDIASQEIERLKLNIAIPRNTITIPDTKGAAEIELTPEEHHRLRRLTGQQSHEWINNFVTSPEYREVPKPVQKAFIKELHRQSAKMARQQVLGELIAADPARVSGPMLELINEFLTPSEPVP